ncbi:MAG: DUF721 domain-containing protein [Desulfobacteraceae bacterium]|nr:DUF721 domain-containing protein [Desulfobacteraceae bacterium]
MKNRRNSDLTPLGDILDTVVSRYQRRPEGKLSNIWDEWEGAVGRIIAENARPSAFKGDLLLVNVSNSTWLQQLRFLKQEMLQKLNDALGQESVRDIRFKIGPI